MSDPLAGKIQELLEKTAAARHIPHAVLEIKSGDGKFNWKGAVGKAGPDGTPMQVDTPWFIASINKTMIAAMVLKLHEQRKLDIEDRLVDHLPKELIHGIHNMRGNDHTDRITLRHLLGHGSGLPDWLEDRPKNGIPLVEQIVSENDRDFTLGELMDLVRRMVPKFAPRPVEQGGLKIRYSDTNFLLLEEVVERVTGLGSEMVYQDMLFRPLGMQHTWLTGQSEPLMPTLPSATLYAEEKPMHLPLFLRSINSVYSTTGDLILFLQGLLTGKLFDDRATLALMTSTWNRFSFPTDKAALRAPGWPIEYALGIKRFQLPGWAAPFQKIPAVIGHTGSTGSWLFHCPQLDVYITGTVDQVTAGAVPYRMVPKLLKILKKELGRSR